MRIAVIGAGRLGSAIGDVWKSVGHDVVVTAARSRDDLVRAYADAALVVLAVPFDAIEDLAKLVDFAGKVVVDATNGGGDSVTSGAERVQNAFPGAKVCKALNSVFSTKYVDVAAAKGSASMFYCGDDADAKKIVATALGDMGFEPVDAGPLASARFIEAFGMLVVGVAYRMGRGPFTYKLSPGS